MICEKHNIKLVEYTSLRGTTKLLCEKCCEEELNSTTHKVKAEKERIEQDPTSWPINYPF